MRKEAREADKQKRRKRMGKTIRDRQRDETDIENKQGKTEKIKAMGKNKRGSQFR